MAAAMPFSKTGLPQKRAFETGSGAYRVEQGKDGTLPREEKATMQRDAGSDDTEKVHLTAKTATN